MENFIAIIDTDIGTRVEPITQPDLVSATEIAERLGTRFGNVLSIIVTSFDNFKNEVELSLHSFE